MAVGQLRRVRYALTAGVVTLGVAAGFAPRFDPTRLRRTDFDREVRLMDAEIAAFSTATATRPTDPEAAGRLAYRLYQRATLTGRPEDFVAVRAIVEEKLRHDGSMPVWRLLEATLDVRAHQLDAAQAALAAAPELADNADAQVLAADIAFQRGNYERAQQGYEAALRRRTTWPVLARLAYVAARRGDVPTADRLYESAEEEVTAKEMRAYAWLELQRGQLQFSRGRYAEARVHYQTAARAYSGYWLVDEYMAELMGATREFAEAVELYKRAIARAPRPDLAQQLGDLYLFMGKPREASRWHDEALAGYLESVRRGEVQFLHHLAGFYADVKLDGAEAVKWAREDATRRPHYATENMLAWALYRNGQIAEALDASGRALASGMIDPHAYYQAAAINAAAGRAHTAQELGATLRRMNARYDDFHAHR